MALAHTFARALETRWDRFKRRVATELGLNGTPMIAPYHGFGTADRFRVRARILEDEGVTSAVYSESLWHNLRHTFLRYESDEIPDASVRWEFGDQSGTVPSDEEGFIDVSFEPGSGFDTAKAWHDVHLTLLQAPGYSTLPLGATVRVRTPQQDATVGIISDIDDTIVKTGATNFLKHWRIVVANAPESRRGYPVQPELYTALTDQERNPVFYVSSSPWNLFDLFDRYMVMNAIPQGPMLLKDFGLDADKWLTGGHDGHKTNGIARILDTYPHLPFLLFGDSGQRDLDIYAGIVHRYPNRIRAVIIHDVTPEPRDAEARAEVDRIEEAGVPAIYTHSYADAWDRLTGLGIAPRR